MKKKWLGMDILSEDYHNKLYHRELKATRVLSTAIVHQKEIVPLRDFIENIMDEAGEILKSWGFKENQLNISSN